MPDREEFTCTPEEMGLIPVRTGVAAPFVFACLDADAPDFDIWMGDLPEALAAAGGEGMSLICEYSYDVDVNWKVYVENGMEGYHVRFVHDMLDDFVETVSARHHFDEHGSYTHAFVREQFAMVAPGADHLMIDGRLTARFGHRFPNIIPVISSTSISYLRIDPVGPEKVRLVARAFGRDLTPELADYLRESMDRTNRQDIEAVLLVQQGLKARGLPAGYHAGFLECRIGHFQALVRRALRGSDEKLARAEVLTREMVLGA
jgi:choline monooxygenase